MVTVSVIPIQANPYDILAHIATWPHWPTIQRVAEKEYNVSAEEWAKLLPEYQKFFVLIILGHTGIGLYSNEIDQLWHAHILHTSLYAEFCQQYIGKFVDHTPLLGDDDEGGGDDDGIPSTPPACIPSTPPSCIPDTPPSGNSIKSGRQHFIRAYTSAFGTIPSSVFVSCFNPVV